MKSARDQIKEAAFEPATDTAIKSKNDFVVVSIVNARCNNFFSHQKLKKKVSGKMVIP